MKNRLNVIIYGLFLTVINGDPLIASHYVQGDSDLRGARLTSQQRLNDTNLNMNRWTSHIFKITVKVDQFCSGDVEKAKKGAGFLFDASQGVILTSYKMVDYADPCHIKIKTLDGRTFTSPDVEILAFSPPACSSYYTFLRVRALANDVQIPIDATTRPIKGTEIFYFEVYKDFYNLKSNFIAIKDSIIPGTIIYHTHASLLGKECAKSSSGGPIFNKDGFVIGLLEDENEMTPIYYPHFAYANYINRGLLNTGFFLGVKIMAIEKETLEKYYEFSTPEIQEQMSGGVPLDDSLLSLKPHPGQEQGYQHMDLLLEVEGRHVGTDLIILHELIRGKESVAVKLLRANKVLVLQVPVYKSIEGAKIKIDVNGVHLSTGTDALCQAYGIPIQTPLMWESSKHHYLTHIDDRPTLTFADFVRVLFDVVETEEKDHFTFGKKRLGNPDFCTTTGNDITQWRGKTLYVVQFDYSTHQWIKMDYKDYIKRLKAE
jgi:hypothetical protein